MYLYPIVPETNEAHQFLMGLILLIIHRIVGTYDSIKTLSVWENLAEAPQMSDNAA